MFLIASMFLVVMLIVNFYFYDSFPNPSVLRILVFTFINFLIPILLLPLIIWVSLRVPLFKNWLNLLLHVLLSIVFVVFYVFLSRFFLLAMNGYFLFSESLEFILASISRQFLLSGSMSFLTYWGIVVLSGMQVYLSEVDEITNRANQLEEKLAQATMSTLKAQLKPHFLFNTLNMIDFHLHTDYKKAVDTLDKLEALIKNTFEQPQPDTCSIEEEITFINKYLEIEKFRFGERLKVELEIDEATCSVLIPCYLIQPLVENSIKHGVSQSLGPFSLLIRSYFKDKNLLLEIIDSGTSSSRSKKMLNWGIGLKNIDERLKLFFGEGAHLEIGFLPNQGFRSAVIIPTKYLKI